jgi:hypothetical protein
VPVKIPDAVRCNHSLFGKHRGATHETNSFDSVFPGATYEITATGRLELLVCTYEDRSDPNAQGWKRLTGILTPVFTGERRDLNYHGWLVLTGFGRAKFTDGTLVDVEPETRDSGEVRPRDLKGEWHEPGRIHAAFPDGTGALNARTWNPTYDKHHHQRAVGDSHRKGDWYRVSDGVIDDPDPVRAARKIAAAPAHWGI